MTQALDLIDRLPVADPRTILRELAAYAQRFSLWSVDRFEVTVLLQSGHTLTGKAARLGRDLDGDCVLLYQGDEKNPALVYIRLADVVGVRLNDPQIAARVFSEKEKKVRTGEAPTRLQIKRDAEKISQELKAAQLPGIDCLWTSVGETPDEHYNVFEMIQTLPGVLKKIAEDPLGAQALKAVSAVTVRGNPGAALHGARSAQGLDLSYDFRRSLPDSLEAELQKVVEAAI